MSGTHILCRELLSGDYRSLMVYASLVGAAAVRRKTVLLKMQKTHNVNLSGILITSPIHDIKYITTKC